MRIRLAMALWLLAPPVFAAVPGQANFQGLLLDSGGQAVTGSADFDFGLFPSSTGGSASWTESHLGVAVQDGVYQVTLGETTPLTPALLSGGELYLEIAVDGETLSPRQRLLAVPFALRADTAENAESVEGLAGGFYTQMLEHWNFDSMEPPNLDPREGLDDLDGDGFANFIDTDNDGDGMDDASELGQGSDMNLPTPVLTGFDPPTADGFLVTSIEVQGQNFSPGLSVVIGTQTPAPANITPTSFDVDAGPQPEGTVGVTVTLANGESDATTFDFFFLEPTLAGFSPAEAPADVTTSVTIQGADFQSPSVVFGSETPTPTNVTSTSFDVLVGPQASGSVSVVVTNGNGKSDSLSFPFTASSVDLRVFVTHGLTDGAFGGLAAADAICAGEASGAGLSGTFLAWLADASQSPDTRLRKDAGPYRLVDGTLVATDWNDLTDGAIIAPIDLGPDGIAPGLPQRVWSNVQASGIAGGGHCINWNSTLFTGNRGNKNSTTSGWTHSGTQACGDELHLYCFEN